MGSVISNGLTNGSIYAIVAFGFVLIYRNSGVMNFAHPQIGMIGAFLFFSLWVEQSWPYLLAAACGVGLSALVALASRQLLAPQEGNPLNMLLGTLGIGGVLTWYALDTWDANPQFVPRVAPGVVVEFWGMRFTGAALLVIGALVVVTTGAGIFYRYAKTGLALRSVANDPLAATYMGINVERMSSITWAASGALAGLAGVLVSPFINMDPFFMSLLFLRALTAALLAGMRSLPLTALAGICIGLVEAQLIRETNTPGLTELMLVIVIIAALLLRPQSLGRRTA